MIARRWIHALPVALLLGGCGADPNKEEDAAATLEPAVAARATYRDFEAVALTNGLVSVQVVPKLGGRALGYEFDGRPLMYANPKLFGQVPGEESANHQPWLPATATEPGGGEPQPTTSPSDAGAAPAASAPADATPSTDIEEVPGGGVEAAEPESAEGPTAPATMAEAEEVGEPVDTATLAAEEPLRYLPSPQDRGYQNYGGLRALPVPRSHWSREWPPPLPADLGQYAETLDPTDGEVASVALAGPADDELGVTLSRRLALLRGSTVLRVEHLLKNSGAVPRPWSLADVSQHPGALSPGESFTRDALVFLPLDPASRHHLGFASLLGPATSDQFKPEAGLLAVEYLGEETLVGGDSKLGWIAYADRRNEVVLIKIAHLPADGVYPEGGITSTVYCSPSSAESYLELGLRSPLVELKPGDELRFAVDYGAARCPLPIVAASRVGCVNTPLKAEQAGDTVTVSGVFGVFFTGTAQLAFIDENGEALARTQPVECSPRQPLRLETVAPLPQGTVRVALIIANHQRVDMGELAGCGVIAIEPRLPEQVAAPAAVPPVEPTAAIPDVDLPAAVGPAGPDAEPLPEAGETPPATPPADGE